LARSHPIAGLFSQPRLRYLATAEAPSLIPKDAAMSDILSEISAELDAIRAENLWKTERNIVTPQSGHVRVAADGAERDLLNLCANNYLGVADDPRLVAAAKQALDSHGLGMASVRFICGTTDLHLRLERAVAA
jgi:glycine C-acetyltransferase